MNRLRRLVGDGRGARGRGQHATHPGGSGAPPGGTKTACEELAGLGQPAAGNTRRSASPRKRGLELSGRSFAPTARAATARREAPRTGNGACT